MKGAASGYGSSHHDYSLDLANCSMQSAQNKRKMDIFKVTGTPLATNISAIFNYKKQGFVVEGIQKDHVMLSDGTRTDVIQFAIFREAYERLASGYSLANRG